MNSAQDKVWLEARLRERLLLTRAVPGDRLMLADATLLAALDGSRALTPNERHALQQSPLTLRRLRQLSLQRRTAAQPEAPDAQDAAGPVSIAPQPGAVDTFWQVSSDQQPTVADRGWQGSTGMLRAAASGTALTQLVTDDGHWTLDFVHNGQAWQVILALSPQAPFAAQLLRSQPLLRVVDGGGAIVLQGRLDADGECERSWSMAAEPSTHFHLYGAGFAVEPVVY